MTLEQRGLLLGNILDSLGQLYTSIILKLLLWLAEDVGKDRDELRCKFLDSAVAKLIETNNALIDWLVLFVVFLEWKEVDENWENICDWDLIWVGDDHAADTSGGVIQSASTLGLEERLKLLKDLIESWEICVRVG